MNIQKQKNTAVHTTHAVVAVNAEGFSKKVGSLCVDVSKDQSFLLLDTTIDYANLPRPNGVSTVLLRLVKKGEPHYE